MIDKSFLDTLSKDRKTIPPSYEELVDLIEESRHLLVLCSLIDKSELCNLQVDKIDKILGEIK